MYGGGRWRGWVVRVGGGGSPRPASQCPGKPWQTATDVKENRDWASTGSGALVRSVVFLLGEHLSVPRRVCNSKAEGHRGHLKVFEP